MKSQFVVMAEEYGILAGYNHYPVWWDMQKQVPFIVHTHCKVYLNTLMLIEINTT